MRKMTLNKDGSIRKLRVNDPKNFDWDEYHSTFAYFCYRTHANKYVRELFAKKLHKTPESIKTRIGEFKIYESRGKTEKVCQMTVEVFNKNAYRTFDECLKKLNFYLDGVYIPSEVVDETEVEQISEVEKQIEVDDIVIEDSLVPLVKTKELIQQIIDKGIVKLGGDYINEKNLRVLKDKTSLEFIETQAEGCYFIFSTLPLKEVPVMSEDGDKNYENTFIIKDGVKFHCLYNGKSGSVRERLKIHLFNSHTLLKIKAGEASTISGTGAMSLVSLSAEEFAVLEREGKYIPSKHKLKPVSKSIQDCSPDKRENHLYFLNGIDITEDPWTKHQFAVIVLKSDSEFGKILIEEAFCVQNGRPPLCRRHG